MSDAVDVFEYDFKPRYSGDQQPGFEIEWTVTGATRNLVGATVEMTVRPREFSNTVTETLSTTNGKLTIPDTANLKVVGLARILDTTKYVRGETYVYSIRITYSGPSPQTRFKGKIPILW